MATGQGPKRWQRGAQLTSRRLQELNDGIVQRTTATGATVSRVGPNETIDVPQPLPYRGPFLARITGRALVSGANTRWRYAWTEVKLDSDTTTDLTRTGTTDTDYALNLREMNNVEQGTGMQGNSVDDSGDAYPSNFSIQPVGGGTGGTPGNEVVVLMSQVRDAGGVRRYVFEYENADDGTCS